MRELGFFYKKRTHRVLLFFLCIFISMPVLGDSDDDAHLLGRVRLSLAHSHISRGEFNAAYEDIKRTAEELPESLHLQRSTLARTLLKNDLSCEDPLGIRRQKRIKKLLNYLVVEEPDHLAQRGWRRLSEYASSEKIKVRYLLRAWKAEKTLYMRRKLFDAYIEFAWALNAGKFPGEGRDEAYRVLAVNALQGRFPPVCQHNQDEKKAARAIEEILERKNELRLKYAFRIEEMIFIREEYSQPYDFG